MVVGRAGPIRPGTSENGGSMVALFRFCTVPRRVDALQPNLRRLIDSLCSDAVIGIPDKVARLKIMAASSGSRSF